MKAGPAPGEVFLVDLQRVLSLFAQGLSGRYMPLKSIDPPLAPDVVKPGGGRPGARILNLATFQLNNGSAQAGTRPRQGAGRGEPLRTDVITTDGSTIYLPASVATFDRPRHNLGVYRVAILHQLGLLEFGTYGFSFARAGELIDELSVATAAGPHPVQGGTLAGGISAVGASASGAFASNDPADGLSRLFSARPVPALMRRLFMTLEDMRIDHALLRSYPGAREDVQRVLARALADRPLLADDASAFALMFDALVRFTLGASHAQLIEGDDDDPPRTATLRTVSDSLSVMLDAAAPLREASATVYDSARAAIRCYALLEQAGLPRRPAASVLTGQRPPRRLRTGLGAEDADEVGATPDQMPFDEQVLMTMSVDFRGEVAPELVQQKLAAGHVGTLPDAKSPITPDKSAADANLPIGAAPVSRPRHRAADVDPALRSFLYDEWDYKHQHYLKGWCRLFEYPLTGDDFGFVKEVRRRHAVLAQQIKRRFGFIRPASWRRVRKVNDGEELELDGVIDAVIDRRTGHAGDEHVYMRRERALREVAAAFLVDMSASTDFPVPDPEAVNATATASAAASAKSPADDYPYLYGGQNATVDTQPAAPKRRVIDVAKEALALMSDALQTLGDSYAIYGFSGDGREKVEFHIAKEFDARLSGRTWTALAAMEPRRSTRMGPAIRHALTKLARQSARLKVLIIVSDGYPEDHDYGPDRNDDEYGIQDTARALWEAEVQGVQAFCVTIDPSGHDYLRRMCAGNRYMVIDDVADLPDELTKVYRTLTA